MPIIQYCVYRMRHHFPRIARTGGNDSGNTIRESTMGLPLCRVLLPGVLTRTLERLAAIGGGPAQCWGDGVEM